MLNESKGNMYPWVTHTWNPIKGECPNDCSYCYMKKWGNVQKPMHLVEKELRVDLQKAEFVFVGSSTDMLLATEEMITPVLTKCLVNKNIKYLFQTKVPAKFNDWLNVFNQLDCVLACTIESDLDTNPLVSKAPLKATRYDDFFSIDYPHKMVSIEPVMDFNPTYFLRMIDWINPDFVSIGANTNSKVKLPEPSPEKLRDFIEKLSGITEVVQKKNLKRLLN